MSVLAAILPLKPAEHKQSLMSVLPLASLVSAFAGHWSQSLLPVSLLYLPTVQATHALSDSPE